MNKKIKKNLATFLFEAAALKRLQRTGWQILGGENKESIAEHSFMVSVIGYILAKKEEANLERVLVISLFHDFEEARTGDIYKLADLYVSADKSRAFKDIANNSPDTEELIRIAKEYEEAYTLESKIVHDADTLALCLELKQLIEKSNPHAQEWFDGNIGRLYLDYSKKLAYEIRETDSQAWWKKERDKIHKSEEK